MGRVFPNAIQVQHLLFEIAFTLERVHLDVMIPDDQAMDVHVCANKTSWVIRITSEDGFEWSTTTPRTIWSTINDIEQVKDQLVSGPFREALLSHYGGQGRDSQ